MSKFPFNRPAIYTALLSEQVMGINSNHAVYSSVVSDEYTIRTPDALMSGLATQMLIQSCCPTLLNPSKILLCDIQHLLAIIKIATQGPNLEVLLKCPKCGEHDPYEINLQHNITTLSAKMWFHSLNIENLFINFRSPTYEEFCKFSIEDFKLSKQLYQLSQLDTTEDYSGITASLLEKKRQLQLDFQTLCITSISDNNEIITSSRPYIKEWFNQCDISIQKKIVSYIDAARDENRLKNFIATCTTCSHDFTVPIDLDVSNIFRQKLIPASEPEILDIINQFGQETKDITNDLLKMIWYMRGSISYSESYGLTLYERQCISKIIETNIELTKESGMVFI